MSVEKDIIVTWLKRIQDSELSVSQFTSKHTVPFSRSQYFVYKKKLVDSGIDGLVDLCSHGGNRKMDLRLDAFLQGYVARGGSISLSELQKLLIQEFLCEVDLTTITRKLDKIAQTSLRSKRGRPSSKLPKIMYN